MKIDLNPQFKQALAQMESGKESLFITGRAGTGKSTLLSYFRDHTNRNLIVLAPTGVSAVNIGGATIHSFFKFKPNITPEKASKKAKHILHPDIYLNLDAIVIDEISMVRADLFDSIDAFMRRIMGNNLPFGGKQMILFGDLYQLPPVVTSKEKAIFQTHYQSPFFFSAKVMSDFKLKYLELTKIYRQSDPTFIEILNSVRSRTITDQQLELLNARVQSQYTPKHDSYTIYLTGTNRASIKHNQTMLARLSDPQQTFYATASGDFPQNTQPAPQELNLKVGAQVMITHNDRDGRYINGTVGVVKEIRYDELGEPTVMVQLNSGRTVPIQAYTWEMYQFSYSQQKQQIVSKTIGTYTQLPLILAWSITVHKSQGKTFDRVIIDLPSSFAHGQTYVALSRATSLEGIILKAPLSRRHILMDYTVSRWLTEMQYNLAHQHQSVNQIRQILETAITQESAVFITYLKSSNVKSERNIYPHSIRQQSFKGHQFIGVDAYDELRHDFRVFRLDRILTAHSV